MNQTEWERSIPEQLPGLRRYARALTQNIHSADDLVQDCLERAWSRRSSWQAGSNLRAWLFAIMHNIFISDIRRNKRVIDSDYALDETSENCTHEHNHLLRDLERCLAQMKPEHREVVILAGLENMQYKEIAEIINAPIGTVMSRLCRGREELRELMSGNAKPRLVRIK